MPRSTNMVNELFPGAFTNPRDWYCGEREQSRNTCRSGLRPCPCSGQTSGSYCDVRDALRFTHHVFPSPPLCKPQGSFFSRGPTPAHVHRCLRPLSGGCDLCCSRSASGWAGPHLAGSCSRCCRPAAGSAPLQESAEQRDRQRGPQRACRGRAGIGKGAGGRPTHTLDHHGASPVRGLGPGYLLNIVNHHGADAVRISITAVGKRKVGPSRSCLPYSATGSR